MHTPTPLLCSLQAAEQQRQSESHNTSKGSSSLGENVKEEDHKTSSYRHARKSPITARKSPQPSRKSPPPSRVADEGKGSRSGREGRRDSPKEDSGGRSSREGSKVTSKSETKSTKSSLSESRSASRSKVDAKSTTKTASGKVRCLASQLGVTKLVVCDVCCPAHCRMIKKMRR